MKKPFTMLLALLAFVGVKANDGAFYSKGNQLIPITETTILVHKEILTITYDQTRSGFHRFKVNVYYEFYNPSSFVEGFKSQYYNLYLDLSGEPISKEGFTDEQLRILKNIPFAYRGYVFNSKDLQSYFESTQWYVPNPEYKPDLTKLDRHEKEWVQFWL